MQIGEPVAQVNTPKQEFELLELKMVHEELKEMREHQVLDARAEYVAGRINQYCQMIIWGDKQNPDFFQFFCEEKGMDLLFSLLAVGRSRDLLVSLISNVSKLITNLSKQNLQVLLNSHALMSFQMIKFTTVSTEVAEYYVNFLKVLSQKVDDTTVQLVFNHKYPGFALAWQAIRFYNHPETLIRTTCRNIVLSLARINQPHVKAFMSSFPFVIFYSHLSAFIREHWLQIDAYMDKRTLLDSQAKRAHLLQAIQDHHDLILYLQDLIKLNHQGITHAILDGFLTECVCPLYKTTISNNKEQFSINFVLYMLGVLFKIAAQGAMADSLAIVFFGKYQFKAITEKLGERRTQLASYSQTWSFKHYWDAFDEVLQKYNKDNYQRVGRNQQENASLAVPFWEETLAFFTLTRPKFQSEHNKIVEIYGLGTSSLGLAQLITYLSQNLKIGGILDLTNFDDNPAKDILFSFMKSKDDTLVMLTLQLLVNLMKCKGISKHVLQFCGLDARQKSTQFYTRTNFEKLLKQAIEILKLQLLPFRLCTIKNAIELIEIICKPYVGSIEEIITAELKFELVFALKMAVERIKVHFETHKGLVSLVQLFEKSSTQFNKIRPKTLATFGIVQVGTEADLDLYDKYAGLSTKQLIQRDFFIFFLLKNMLQNIKMKPVEVLKLKPASDKDLQYLSRYPKYKQIEMKGDIIQCGFRFPQYQKHHKGGIFILKCGFIVAEHSNGKNNIGIIRVNSTYHNIVKLQIQPTDHNLMKVKMAKGCGVDDFQLLFDNYKGTTSTKIKMEDCRFEMARFVFEQINSSLSRTIQQTVKSRS